MATLNLAITSGADDGFQEDTGDTTHSTTAEICDQEDEYFLFRFQNVTIPQGSTINSVDFKVYITGSTTDEPDHRIYCDDADNSAAITAGTGNDDISLRTETSSVVNWSSADLGSAGGLESTPNIVGPIQEVINRAGWASGNALSIIIHGRIGIAGTSDLGIDFYDLDPSRAATLDIEYTAATPDTGINQSFTDNDTYINSCINRPVVVEAY